jgi:hypothetical protein
LIEAQIAGETEVSEGVPRIRSAFGGGVVGVARQDVTDKGFIREDSGGVDVGVFYLRVLRKDGLRFIEGSRSMRILAGHAGGADEGSNRIMERPDRFLHIQAVDVGGELRPALETVFARDDQLGAGKRNPRRGAGGLRPVAFDAGEGIGISGRARTRQLPGLFSVLFEIRAGGQ